MKRLGLVLSLIALFILLYQQDALAKRGGGGRKGGGSKGYYSKGYYKAITKNRGSSKHTSRKESSSSKGAYRRESSSYNPEMEIKMEEFKRKSLENNATKKIPKPIITR